MASAITFGSLNYTGTPSSDDVLAATFIVRLENEKIAAQNAILAAQDPPGEPLPLWNTVGAGLKTSYLAILTAIITNAHASYIQQATADTARFTDAQWAQMKANVNARLNAGETAAAIVADTAS